jgi:predicted nucleic acid-binding protein
MLASRSVAPACRVSPRGPPIVTDMPFDAASIATHRPAHVVVLDTNVVLDWLLFRDPGCVELSTRIEAGTLTWFATESMRHELEHVLTRPEIMTWKPDMPMIRATWARWVHTAEVPQADAGSHFRCTDPDDQKFIDLALHLSPATLLSRDRAVLRLAGRARHAGVQIMTTETWAAHTRAAGTVSG